MKLSLAIAAAVLACGCTQASAPPPRAASFASAIDMSTAAARMGGKSDENVARRLRLARQEIDVASELARQGKNEEATRELARADADAELALELARETVARTRARDARAALEVAREGDSP